MDKVREFDKVLKEKEEQRFLMMRVVQIIFFGLSGMMMFLPFDSSEVYISIIFPWYLLGMGVVFSLQPYMDIKDGQKLIKIYKYLEYMPVEKEDIFKVRREYLNRMCKKIGIAYVVCQCITAALMKEFNVVTILYPVAMTGCVWLMGLVNIRSGMRK